MWGGDLKKGRHNKIEKFVTVKVVKKIKGGKEIKDLLCLLCCHVIPHTLRCDDGDHLSVRRMGWNSGSRRLLVISYPDSEMDSHLGKRRRRWRTDSAILPQNDPRPR